MIEKFTVMYFPMGKRWGIVEFEQGYSYERAAELKKQMDIMFPEELSPMQMRGKKAKSKETNILSF